jgi:hypothetical protein
MSTPDFENKLLMLLRIKTHEHGYVEIDLRKSKSPFGSAMDVYSTILELEKKGRVEIIQRSSTLWLVRSI